MTCASPLPINKFTNNPILIGFPWKTQLTFNYRPASINGVLQPLQPLDLSLYNIYFAIAPSLTSAISLVPTITKYPNGLATFEYSDVQTTGMTTGLWTGHCFVELIANGAPDFKMELQIKVIDPVPTP